MHFKRQSKDSMATETESLNSYDPPPVYQENKSTDIPSSDPPSFPDDKKAQSTANEQDSLAQAPSSSSAAQILHIKFGNMLWTKAQFLDPSNSVIYNASFSMKKPWVTVKSPEDSIIGTATFHWTSCRIDVRVNDDLVDFKSLGIFKDGFKFQSKALGQTITWKSIGSHCFHVKAMDETGNVVAHVKFSRWCVKQGGIIELLDPRCSQAGLFRDEIVVTGTTVIQSRLISQSLAVT